MKEAYCKYLEVLYKTKEDRSLTTDEREALVKKAYAEYKEVENVIEEEEIKRLEIVEIQMQESLESFIAIQQKQLEEFQEMLKEFDLNKVNEKLEEQKNKFDFSNELQDLVYETKKGFNELQDIMLTVKTKEAKKVQFDSEAFIREMELDGTEDTPIQFEDFETYEEMSERELRGGI